MFDEIDEQQEKWFKILSRSLHPDDAPPDNENHEEEDDLNDDH